MAIAQNYLAAYSISATLNINDYDIIQELENVPLYPGRGEVIIKNKVIINKEFFLLKHEKIISINIITKR